MKKIRELTIQQVTVICDLCGKENPTVHCGVCGGDVCIDCWALLDEDPFEVESNEGGALPKICKDCHTLLKPYDEDVNTAWRTMRKDMVALRTVLRDRLETLRDNWVDVCKEARKFKTEEASDGNDQ